MKETKNHKKSPKTKKEKKKVIPKQVISSESKDKPIIASIKETDTLIEDNKITTHFQPEEAHAQPQDEHLRRSDNFRANSDYLSISDCYEISLLDAISERTEKVEVIENKIERLIEKQINKIRILNQGKPNKYLSLPRQTKKWSRNLQKQQSTLVRLKERLSLVHEIKEKITHEGPQLEILAQRKLNFQNPSLVNAFISSKEEERKKKLKHKQINIYKRSHKRTLKRGLKQKLR